MQLCLAISLERKIQRKENTAYRAQENIRKNLIEIIIQIIKRTNKKKHFKLYKLIMLLKLDKTEYFKLKKV